MDITEQTDVPLDPPPGPERPPNDAGGVGSRRRLTRSTTDRMIAGVAGGVGEYLDIDPVLVRIGFALLSIFGGSGLALYVLAWVLLPEEGANHSIADEIIDRRAWRGRGRRHRVGTIILFVVAALIITSPFRHSGWGHDWFWTPLVLAGVAVAVLSSGSRRARAAADAGPPLAARFDQEPSSTYGPWSREVERPESLATYLIGGLAVLGGLAALLDHAGWWSISVTSFLAICLALTGVLLVIGAVRGRVGGLVALGLVLAAVLVASLALPGAVGDGIGARQWHPSGLADLQATYRLGSGDATLDLTSLATAASPIPVRASVETGHLRVIVPAGTNVRAHERVGVGEADLFGSRQGGVSVNRTTLDGASGPVTVDLDVRVGVGKVDIERAA